MKKSLMVIFVLGLLFPITMFAADVSGNENNKDITENIGIYSVVEYISDAIKKYSDTTSSNQIHYMGVYGLDSLTVGEIFDDGSSNKYVELKITGTPSGKYNIQIEMPIKYFNVGNYKTLSDNSNLIDCSEIDAYIFNHCVGEGWSPQIFVERMIPLKINSCEFVLSNAIDSSYFVIDATYDGGLKHSSMLNILGKSGKKEHDFSLNINDESFIIRASDKDFRKLNGLTGRRFYNINLGAYFYGL